MNELQDSISKAHNTAVGPDEIHFELLRNLPKISREYLLSFYNDIWTTGNIPKLWKQAIIVPIAKNQNCSDPTNYRPIALTSCTCKILERMINDRLTWYLEKNKLITNIQSGFRKNRSAIDQLVRLETFIRDAFIKKEHLTAIFFDLKKAYDTTWRYDIMKDLESFGLKVRLPQFINNFLTDRNFKTWIGNEQIQEMGVPQGSILNTV